MSNVVRHPDGIYIDLPIEDYVADDAIGGHGVYTLATSPSDWRWQRGDNPLYQAPKSDARSLGSVVHCLLLEGRAEFERRYALPPSRDEHPDAIATATDCKARLKKLEAEHMAHLGVAKLTREERQPFLQSGTADELAARVRALQPDAVFWEELVAELVGGRTELSKDEAIYGELVTKLALAAYGDLLEIESPTELGNTGLSEVSMFWTEPSGIRFKVRWDRITPSRIVDVKKYGTTPKPQHSLRQHLVLAAASYGYAPQAVLQSHGARKLASDPDFPVHTGTPEARATLRGIAGAWASRSPTFWWLFLRCPGPPGGKPIPFRPSDAMWQRAEEMIADAVFNYTKYRERFGDDLWLDAQDPEEISSEVGALSDWPAWAFQSPLEDR